MLLDQYESNSLLTNQSVKGATSTAGQFAFRGDLVIEEGDIADAQGRRHPPKVVVKQAVILASDSKMLGIAGEITQLEYLTLFSDKYSADLDPTLPVVLYVANLGKPAKVEWSGVNYILIPHSDGGAVWNTLMDDLRLDKEDFKGQSPEDKVITMFDAIKSFKPKYEAVSYDDALKMTVVITREARGPV